MFNMNIFTECRLHKITHTLTKGSCALKQSGSLAETLGRAVIKTKIDRRWCYNYHFLLKFSEIMFPHTPILKSVNNVFHQLLSDCENILLPQQQARFTSVKSEYSPTGGTYYL